MKKIAKNLVLILAIAGITSCNSNKKATVTEDGTEVVKVRMPDETPESKAEEKDSVATVEGEVKEINQGKDGYTAILTTEGGIYYVTISIPNLKDPKQYRVVKIGETIKVSGDSWKMEEDNYITVRELF
ncbi:hypothetical protein [Flavobacterium macacae]|uniref:Uncharacterized protein n=1 Tax=Flavobacterium macacae TaxID=2488993 RepID=A0A3P3W3C3_9FLAO|nr:hypothetical protein [Flavobacterium macacae]RRJ88878.1 hypothetical protein EG849_14115 [Flavobacterium macacae]